MSQLNAEGFLARFFSGDMLGKHAELLGKSSKGNESVLAARIAKVSAHYFSLLFRHVARPQSHFCTPAIETAKLSLTLPR